MEIFNGQKSGKLQTANGGSWLVFSSDSEDFNWTGSSCALPTLGENDRDIIKQLRDWVKREQPGDIVDMGGAPASDRHHMATGGSTTAAVSHDATNTTLNQIALESYSCFSAQVLRRAILSRPSQINNKLAVLTVWDGTKRRLDFNCPTLNDFTVDSLNGPMLGRLLPDYCYNLVLYGDHIERSRQLRLGGVYNFYGVHCKLYVRVGKPELYLHERNRCLAGPISSKADRKELVKRLQKTVDELGEMTLDISK